MAFGEVVASSGYVSRLKARAWVGPVLMLSSAFIFSLMDCLIKFLNPSFRIWDIAFYRFGCGMAILVLLFGRHGNPFSTPDMKLLLVRGIAGCLSFLALVYALRMIPLSTAMVLFYSYPAFATLFASLFSYEKAGIQIVWAVLAFCGVVVFLDPHLEGGLLGQVMSLLGAAFAGIAVASIRKASKTNGPVIIYLYFCVTGAVVSFLPFVAGPRIPVTLTDGLMVAGIICTSVVAQLLMNHGFRYCGTCEGGLLLTSEVIFVAIYGFVFLGESITWRFWVGGMMILGSIVALSLSMPGARVLAPGKDGNGGRL